MTVSPEEPLLSSSSSEHRKSVLPEPAWVELHRDEWGEKLAIQEWEDEDSYRRKNGWKGQDYIHDQHAPVHIPDYFVRYGTGEGLGPDATLGGVGTTLTGLAIFTERAESHRGMCHGGSMCSVMDDIVGWCAFCVTGRCRPWTGFTVQVNTSLLKPIFVNTTLLVRATVVRMERRKVHIEAEIIDPSDNNNVHAKCEGLVVLNRGVISNLTESIVSHSNNNDAQ